MEILGIYMEGVSKILRKAMDAEEEEFGDGICYFFRACVDEVIG